MEGLSYENLGYEPANPDNELGYESPTSVYQFPIHGKAKRRNTISRDVPPSRGIQRTSEVYHQGSQTIMKSHLRRRASIFACSNVAAAAQDGDQDVKKTNNDFESTMLRRNSMTRVVPTSRGIQRTYAMYKQGSQELPVKRSRRASILALTASANKPLPSCMKKDSRTRSHPRRRRDVAPTIPSRKVSIGHTDDESSAIEPTPLATAIGVSGKFEIKPSGIFLVYNPQTQQRGISPLSFYNLLKDASSNTVNGAVRLNLLKDASRNTVNGEVKINNKTIMDSKANTKKFIPTIRPATIPNKVVSWAA